MWMHIITVYLMVSIVIMEIMLKDKIGTQPYPLQRASFYISGLLIGPFVALVGIGIGIVKIWNSRGR